MKLTEKVLETVATTVASALPPGSGFVLLVQCGEEAAMLSPHGIEVAHEMLRTVLAQVGPKDAPDAVLVPRRR